MTNLLKNSNYEAYLFSGICLFNLFTLFVLKNSDKYYKEKHTSRLPLIMLMLDTILFMIIYIMEMVNKLPSYIDCPFILTYFYVVFDDIYSSHKAKKILCKEVEENTSKKEE